MARTLEYVIEDDSARVVGVGFKGDALPIASKLKRRQADLDLDKLTKAIAKAARQANGKAELDAALAGVALADEFTPPPPPIPE